MVTRINTFEAQPGKAGELRDFLASVIDAIIDAAGCRSVELLIGRDSPSRLAIVETWDSVDAHKAAAGRIPPEMMQKAMTLFASPPGGAYYESQLKKTASSGTP